MAPSQPASGPCVANLAHVAPFQPQVSSPPIGSQPPPKITNSPWLGSKAPEGYARTGPLPDSCRHISPSHSHVSPSDRPSPDVPPCTIIRWRTGSYPAAADRLSGGPLTARSSHSVPSNSQVLESFAERRTTRSRRASYAAAPLPPGHPGNGDQPDGDHVSVWVPASRIRDRVESNTADSSSRLRTDAGAICTQSAPWSAHVPLSGMREFPVRPPCSRIREEIGSNSAAAE